MAASFLRGAFATVLVAAACSATAATLRFTGIESELWSDARNWEPNVVPRNGDTLVTGSAYRWITRNDLGPIQLRQVDMPYLDIAGDTVEVMVALKAGVVDAPIKVGQGRAVVDVQAANGGLDIGVHDVWASGRLKGLSGTGTLTTLIHGGAGYASLEGSGAFSGTVVGSVYLRGADLPDAKIVVPRDSFLTSHGATVGDIDIVGTLDVAEGTLHVGNLHSTGRLNTRANTRIVARGHVHLGNSTVYVYPDYSALLPQPGSQVVVIDNDGTDPITGDPFYLEGYAWYVAGLGEVKLLRTGGDGNDLAWVVTWVEPTAGDLNRDRTSDILWRHASTGEVHRMFTSGLQVFGSKTIYREADVHWRVVGQGDMTGDGVPDLLWRHEVNGQVYVMPFGADGEVRPGAVVHVEPDTAWRVVSVGDLDGDHRDDILWWNAFTGEVHALLMDGLRVKASQPMYREPDTQWRIEAVGSSDGRRKVLFWRNATTGEVVRMYLGIYDGPPAFSKTTVHREPDPSWHLVGAGDLDGDGNPDMLWRNSVTGMLYGMLQDANRAGFGRRGVIHQAHADWRIVAFGDYDGDGTSDLLWQNQADGRVFMMLMDGLSASVRPEGHVYREPDLQWQILGPAHFRQ